MPPSHPIPDSYWVRPGRFLAGEYPGAPADEQARSKLAQLLAAGVDTFIDLTEAGEYNLNPYAPLLPEAAKDLERSVEHQRHPIRDMDTPSPAQMTHLLDTIDELLGAGRTIYLHCYGGIGRTGTVAGCFLVRHGLSGDQALQEIARRRQGTPDGHRRSPETSAQRRMVRNWGG